jgi:hypothetical protein
MWLLIPEGFYSVVRKYGDERLCVRARVREDLDRLRERFLPELTETVETAGSDYRYRAWVEPEQFAAGLAEIGRGIDYPNFKNEVGRVDPDRASPYHEVWGALGRLQPGGPYST